MKICFAASSGGHLEEILCLKKIAEENDSFLITEDQGNMGEKKPISKCYLVPQINRKEKGFLIHFFNLFRTEFKIMKKEKPDCIISTGALVTVPICIIGKLCGKKIIYIESFARITEKSLSGRIIYPFADLFLVQWEELLELYPRATFIGGIF